MVEDQTVEAHNGRHFFGRFSWQRRGNGGPNPETTVDDLTGLRNHRALWRELSRRSQACSPSRPLALVMVDLDQLGNVNRTYGHDVGDAVLERAASVLRSTVPFPRHAFRYGGEEFVVLVEPRNGEARELAERVRSEIAAQNGALPMITVSCGVAELDEPVLPWVALDRADAALREAKRAGRNRVALAGRTSPGERVQLVEELERETARRAAMALAIATLEVRDTETAEHSDDVLTLCEAISRRLGFDDGSLQQLGAAAQLHDIGKVAIPSAILNKPGALNDDEWAVIREHTVIGERILRSVPEMAEVAMVVRHSHEHWNGSGYPDGLAGEQIPLASRVILCADAFHAMRADRPYRRGRPADEAIAEVRSCAGTQFDPAVVDAFVDVVQETRKARRGVLIGPRNRRLVALLTALVIGSGSAVAAVPEVREAIRSVFGVITSPSSADTPGAPEPDIGFGPLGVMPKMASDTQGEPATRGKGDKHEAATNPDKPQKNGSGTPDRDGSRTGPAAGPDSDERGDPGRGPDRGDPGTPPQDGGSTPPESGANKTTPPPTGDPTPPPSPIPRRPPPPIPRRPPPPIPRPTKARRGQQARTTGMTVAPPE